MTVKKLTIEKKTNKYFIQSTNATKSVNQKILYLYLFHFHLTHSIIHERYFIINIRKVNIRKRRRTKKN